MAQIQLVMGTSSKTSIWLTTEVNERLPDDSVLTVEDSLYIY